MEEEEAVDLQPKSHKSRRTRPLTKTGLRELLMEKQPFEIILRLASADGGLDQLVANVSLSNEEIVLLICALDKALIPSLLTFMRDNIKDILEKFLNSDFLNFSLFQLVQNLTDKQDHKIEILKGTSKILRHLLDIFPDTAFIKIVAFQSLLREKISGLPGALDSELQAEHQAFEELFKYHASKRSFQKDPKRERYRGFRVGADDEHAQDNFRNLPLIPMQQELTSDEEVFLRCNIINGRYENIEQYLDTQFRLFRADLILPLRESIDKFLGSCNLQDKTTGCRKINVYRGVRVLRPVCKERNIAYRLSFDVSNLSSVDWRTTQRLKYGSLLCLSHDNFATFICAAVQEHEPNLLSNGLVDVVFLLEQDELHQVTEMSRDKRFVMVESPAYFEAYRHVLQGLKNMNQHSFPFQQYIVDCQIQVHPAQYLQRGNSVKYDFRPLLQKGFVVKDTTADLGAALDLEDVEATVEVMSENEWPSQEVLGLDASQQRALYLALTREIALIQGPPGTGKTFLGLKLVLMLLHNAHAWQDPEHRCPLLVVCYTNHALDMFLEGLLDHFSGTLVRVGARSKSEKLQAHSLIHYRTRARQNRKTPMEVYEAQLRARDELRSMTIQIHGMAAKLELAEQEIMKESFLEDYIGRHKKLFTTHAQEDCAILLWLGLEKVNERLLYQAQHHLQKLPSALQLKSQTIRKTVVQTAEPHPAANDDDDEDDDDDDDDMMEDLATAVRDSQQQRQLEEDLFDDFDFEMEDDMLDAQETQGEKFHRKMQELEQSAAMMRAMQVALDITGFCDEGAMTIPDEVKISVPKGEQKKLSESYRRLRSNFKRLLQGKLRDTDMMSLEEAEEVTDIWKLKYLDRWRLYRHWVDLLCRQARGEIRDLEQTYCRKARKYEETLQQEDRAILQNATIIGMTTTAAARHQGALQAIGPRIVIVEEAAEVFEAHVVTTLSRECQHLILIGDHKQLRPTPVVYELAKRCGLDISLFERMVNNQFQVGCLNSQHRMRPEISFMMKLPDLYPQLEDHKIVQYYPPICGVAHSVFYINHSRSETHDEETRSYSNEHEATFLVALCAHLLKQGYKPEQVVLLTPYSGQIRLFGKLISKKGLKGVRISSVDNFQGEESDIVLLSLVRSNSDDSIGFLKFNNRICVALSRAKQGLYVIGNLELLKRSSTLLEQVVRRAEGQRVYGNALPLACSNHPKEVKILVRNADDFKQVPEGGCKKQCDVRLACGHVCTRVCHPQQDHEGQPCNLPCAQQCSRCGKRCSADDHLCSGHVECKCTTEIELPRCGHVQPVSCGGDPSDTVCQAECRKIMTCGHRCQGKCGEPHTSALQCRARVQLTGEACGHQFEAECRLKANAKCSILCGQELVCGHVCVGTCGGCQKGRLHVPCSQSCRKVLVCGHKCQSSCCQCPPCEKKCENRCVHSRCDKPCGQPCRPCIMPCDWKCQHHRCTKLCCEPCDRQRCNEPCPKKLPDCGHACIGLCGEPCPHLCRECDKEALDDSCFGEAAPEDRFVVLEECSHVLEVTQLDRWVDEYSCGPVEGTADREVKLPLCPQCKTPIRRNLRYGKEVKTALEQIEEVKNLCRGNQEQNDILFRKVEQARSQLPAELKEKVKPFFENKGLFESCLAAQFYQLTLLTDLSQLQRQVSSAKARWPGLADAYNTLESDLAHMVEWLLLPRSVLTSQEQFDAHQESHRLRLLSYLLHCRHTISTDNIQVEPRLMQRLVTNIRVLQQGNSPSENDLDEGRELQTALQEIIKNPYSLLTDEERRTIVQAVSLPTGHWYACARGHYYVIGECGRPLEEGTCPECRGAIGGQNHALIETNRQAPEMDEAEGPVWSEERDFQLAMLLQQQEYENWR